MSAPLGGRTRPRTRTDRGRPGERCSTGAVRERCLRQRARGRGRGRCPPRVLPREAGQADRAQGRRRPGQRLPPEPEHPSERTRSQSRRRCSPPTASPTWTDLSTSTRPWATGSSAGSRSTTAAGSQYELPGRAGGHAGARPPTRGRTGGDRRLRPSGDPGRRSRRDACDPERPRPRPGPTGAAWRPGWTTDRLARGSGRISDRARGVAGGPSIRPRRRQPPRRLQCLEPRPIRPPGAGGRSRRRSAGDRCRGVSTL